MYDRRRVGRRLAAVGGATVVAGSALMLLAPTAQAVSNIQTGYWSALPAAPQVPSGGYEVGSNASGAHAVAALRFSLAQGETVQKLVLKLAHAEPADQVAIQACPVAAKSASWQPPSGGGPGALSSAPTPDCSSGVFGGALSADGATMTFDLSLGSFPSGAVDLLLQPSQGSTALNSLPNAPSESDPTFDADFDQLTAAQISVTGGPVASAPAPPPVSSGGGSVSAPAPAPAPASGGGSVPSVPLPPASTDTGTAGGAPPVVATQSQQPTNLGNNAAPVALVEHGRNWRMLFFVAMLSSDLLFGLLWLQRHHDAAEGERPKLSIYDPPPSAPPAT